MFVCPVKKQNYQPRTAQSNSTSTQARAERKISPTDSITIKIRGKRRKTRSLEEYKDSERASCIKPDGRRSVCPERARDLRLPDNYTSFNGWLNIYWLHKEVCTKMSGDLKWTLTNNSEVNAHNTASPSQTTSSNHLQSYLKQPVHDRLSFNQRDRTNRCANRGEIFISQYKLIKTDLSTVRK